MSELEKTVAEILIKATNAAEAAGKFATEQLPDIAQQYILYVSIYSWSLVAVGVFVAVFPTIAVWRISPKEDPDYRLLVSFITGIASGFVGGLIVFVNIGNAILATFAPKILLIKFAATLIK